MRLRSSNPDDAPEIRFNLLQSEGDLALLRFAIGWTRTLMSTTPLDRFVGDEALPGPQVSDLDAFIRSTVVTAQHPACTCRMGTDPQSVVDPRLRVHGLEGLRVADASVMPALIGGHTNAAAIMIGERAADFVRG